MQLKGGDQFFDLEIVVVEVFESGSPQMRIKEYFKVIKH